jgi:hypothetical protein
MWSGTSHPSELCTLYSALMKAPALANPTAFQTVKGEFSESTVCIHPAPPTVLSVFLPKQATSKYFLRNITHEYDTNKGISYITTAG